MFLRLIFVLTACVFLSTFAAAQTAAVASADEGKAALEQKQKSFALLEQTIKDADSLKLPENRIHVLEAAANLLWQQDEKRARALFESAAGEFTQAFSQSELTESGLPENFWILQNSRNSLLNRVLNRDPELALELLRRTRPPAFMAVLNLPAERVRLYQNLYSQARGDIQMEQNFAAQIARQNPRRALEIARANLSKGASHADLNLIDELKTKAPEAAARFAEEVLQKLQSADFANANNHNDRSLAMAFLSKFAQLIEPTDGGAANQSKPFRINEAMLRGLAEKYVAYLSSADFQNGNYYEIESSLPVVEKIFPERAAALKRKLETLKQKQAAVNPHNQFYERLNKLNASTASPDQMLAAADDFPVEMRGQIYNSAANKLAQAGDADGARQLLAGSLPPGQTRDYALFNLDQQIVNNFLGKEQFAEAEAVARQQTDRSRKIHFLVVIARHLHNQQKTEQAGRLAAEAFALVNPSPEDFKELNDLLVVLEFSAAIQPDKAFELFESIVPKYNELTAASALLNKYQPHNQAFRDNEFSLQSIGHGGYGGRGGMLFGMNFSSLASLAKTDLQRAANVADRFERNDVRTAARLMILRGVLREDQISVGSPFRRMEILTNSPGKSFRLSNGTVKFLFAEAPIRNRRSNSFR